MELLIIITITFLAVAFSAVYLWFENRKIKEKASKALSEEESDFLRLFILVFKVGPLAVRHLFNQVFPPANLGTVLHNNHALLTNLKRKRVINVAQWDLLFPPAGVATCSTTYDVTLLICLLRNIIPTGSRTPAIPPPSTGFDVLPPNTDVSKGADLARIKHFRNFLAHHKEAKIARTDFNSAWTDICEAIKRLGGGNYDQDCVDLRVASLDESNKVLYNEVLKTQAELKKELAAVKTTSKGLTEAKLNNWKEDDKTFVATTAVTAILKCVEKNKCVTITGSSGMGKTAILRHVVLQMADKGYDIILVNEPRDVEQHFSPDRKTVFIVDDFCGTFSANKIEVDKWKTFIDQSYPHLNTNVKFIVACRLQVFNDTLFQSLPVFKTCVCDLLSKVFKSSDNDLQSIASIYLESEADKVAKYVNLYHCFPLLCKLYKTNPSFELTKFFQNPFSVYETDIDNMLAAGHYRKYCALMLCVIFNNSLEKALLTAIINKESRNIFRNVFEVCKLNRETSRVVLLDELNTLLNTYLKEEGDCYKTVHDKMFDFLSFYFGKSKLTCQCLIQNARSKFIAERFCLFEAQPYHEFKINLDTSLHNLYMERLMNDWQNGDVRNVFFNTNMKFNEFRQTFLKVVESCDKQVQQKMADTCDNETGCTALYMCCIYGDMDWLTWCFNHQIDVNKQETRYGASPLYVACQEGHIGTVTVLLDRGADVNKCTTDSGVSPLYLSCQNGHTETVTVLLDRGADINRCRTDIGASPLYVACRRGHTETVTTLLDRGADINKCTTDSGVSPLYAACQNGHTETVTVLLDRGADINKCTTDIGASPLYGACLNGHTETVTVLLDRGADINRCTTDDGASPLYGACQEGHTETVTFLLERGVDINRCTTDIGASPLYVACQEGHTETVTVLLDRGADINRCTTDIGASPLYVACYEGHTEAVTVLLDRGADINRCTTDFGASPLYVACYKGHTETVTVLLDRGADFNKRTTGNGASPLYVACEYGHIGIVTVLLDRGADINRCTTDIGASPLYVACLNGHTETVTVLLNRGADINKCTTDSGASPLYAACQKGHTETVTVLLNKGADINRCRTDIGASPLYVACQERHTETVTVLLDRGADFNKCTTGNEASPLHLACYCGFSEIVQQLISKGANSRIKMFNGCYPVDLAREMNHKDIVSLLETLK